MSNTASRYGTAPVVNPRGLTYNVTCHQWFISGMCTIRILPTICVHICRVSRVAVHSSTSSDGHWWVRAGPFMSLLHLLHIRSYGPTSSLLEAAAACRYQ